MERTNATSLECFYVAQPQAAATNDGSGFALMCMSLPPAARCGSSVIAGVNSRLPHSLWRLSPSCALCLIPRAFFLAVCTFRKVSDRYLASEKLKVTQKMT